MQVNDFSNINPATGQPWLSVLTSTQSSNSYPGLDANGNTPEEVACFKDPNCDQNEHLLDLLYQDVHATGAGWLPDMNPVGDGIPSWAWLLIAVGGGLFVINTILARR